MTVKFAKYLTGAYFPCLECIISMHGLVIHNRNPVIYVKCNNIFWKNLYILVFISGSMGNNVENSNIGNKHYLQ